MKVLFAVNNDNVSDAIVKKYQKEYKEILSYKNVYYFNAILRELQKDKSYSRIVISEDLEPFANNNYESIDKFLFEKYSGIAEEAKNINNEPIDIILICADRRRKTDDMLVKVYKKGIYNAIIGQDRSIDEVCKLINRPRDKEDARRYYNIQQSEFSDEDSENSVSEAEVQNILAHYKRLGKNEDKFVESFNNIITQYTDTQLRIIIKYLPLNVKAVLEEKSPKYQQLAISTGMNGIKGIDAKRKTEKYKEKLQNRTEDEADEIKQLIKEKKVKNVVVPTNLTTAKVQKVIIPNIVKPTINTNIDVELENSLGNKINGIEEVDLFDMQEDSNNVPETDVNEIAQENKTEIEEQPELLETPKRGRGRPRKNSVPAVEENKPKRGRGRPRKNPQEDVIPQEIEEANNKEDIDLFSIENSKNTKNEEIDMLNTNKETDTEQEDEDFDLFNIDEKADTNQKDENLNLFGIDKKTGTEQEDEEVDLFSMNEEINTEQKDEEVDLFSMNEEISTNQKNEEIDLLNMNYSKTKEDNKISNYIGLEAEVQRAVPQSEEKNDILNTNTVVDTNFRTLLTGDKKIVAFVGTTKNGTSFIVNNTAELLASMGINTAILDMTKTKNAYYIYTNNEENLRITAKNCMENLQNGIAEGIKVNKKLTVYTEMPGEEKEYSISTILSTLLQNYSAVLIDTDFDTQDEIFEKAQEIYLVQTMDVLTIQPLTAFLRNLKSKNILSPEKLKIVINKSTRVRSLNIKTLIGGMSCYNSPSMTYMTELFNKDNIRYCEIPFEVQNYVKYLDSLVNCSISLNGYTKQFMMALKELAGMVYPLVNKQTYSPMNKKTQRDPFSSEVNDTLNKMKNKY